MALCRIIVSLVLSLQLAWANNITAAPPYSSSDSLHISGEKMTSAPEEQNRTTEVTELRSNDGPCAWWCDRTLTIAVVAGLGAIFLISVILCSVSCCLWRRRREHPVMKEMEALTHNVTDECSATLPGDLDKMEAIGDNGVCDVENCGFGNIQDTQDMANNMSSTEYNLPEPIDVPPLAE